jgi:hypothetical protein
VTTRGSTQGGSEAERRLVLLAAGTDRRRQERAAEMLALSKTVDWEQMATALRARHLLASLGPRLLDLSTHAGASFGEAIEEATLLGRRQSAYLQLVAHSAVADLAAEGIPATVLKGPDLGEAIYGDAGRRFSTDIDLLVAPKHLLPAVEIIRTRGYLPPEDFVDGWGLPLLHFALAHENGGLPSIELHWRIHWYEGSFARERLLPPGGSPDPGWHPAPRDQLGALLLYYARDGFLGLRLAADLAAWWDRFGNEVDEGAIGQVSRDYPALGRVLRAAVLAGEQVVGLPARRLTGPARPASRERLARRLADPFPRVGEKQAYAEMSLIDGLLMPPGNLIPFIRRQVLVPAERDSPASSPSGGWPSAARVRAVLVRCGIFIRFLLAVATVFFRSPAGS